MLNKGMNSEFSFLIKKVDPHSKKKGVIIAQRSE